MRSEAAILKILVTSLVKIEREGASPAESQQVEVQGWAGFFLCKGREGATSVETHSEHPTCHLFGARQPRREVLLAHFKMGRLRPREVGSYARCL